MEYIRSWRQDAPNKFQLSLEVSEKRKNHPIDCDAQTFSTVCLSHSSIFLAITPLFDIIVTDCLACLLALTLKCFMTAMSWKNKGTKWTCHEALPPAHLSCRSAGLLRKLSYNSLNPAPPINEIHSWEHTVYQSTMDPKARSAYDPERCETLATPESPGEPVRAQVPKHQP